MKKYRGYTIIELLVTIAITSMFLVLSIGFSRNAMKKANFNASINKFIADFSYARQLASRLNRYVAIDFDVTGTQYSILVQDNIGDFAEANFSQDKLYRQPNGQVFIDMTNTQSLIVNSLGLVREFPMVANAAPVVITAEFIQDTDIKGGTYKYKKRVTIFPSGGLKIETINQ